MATKETKGVGLPTVGMLLLGIGGALVTAAQFEVITVWPQPPAVAPYFGWDVGMWWGLIVGGAIGLIIGFLTDDDLYPDAPSSK